MKTRIIKYLLFFLCISLFISIPVKAEEKESLEEFSGADALWDALPEEADREKLSTLLEEKDGSGLFRAILDAILSSFSLGISGGVKFFLEICALLLFSALFRSVKESFGIREMESAFDFLFVLALSLISFSALQDCIQASSGALSSIQSFFVASLPITTILLTLSGSGGAASTLAANLNFVLGLVSTVISSYLSPLLNTLFAFSVTESIAESGISSLLAFLKKTVKVFCVLFFTLITATLSLQNALASAADSLAMRSVRFAAGNFIPVVGSLVGESAKTLSASFSVVKTECGILCILVLLYVLLRPILCIAVQKLFLSFAGAVSEILGEKQCKGFLSSLSSLLDLLMALVISEGCYLIFYITLFLNNKGSF